jgi:hypothetical protein
MILRAFVVVALSLLAARAWAATPPHAVIGATINAAFAAQNSPYNGPCPVTLRFAGSISGTANQFVTYVFNRTIKGVAASTMPVGASLDGNGHLNVSDSFPVGSPQAGPGSDELQLLPSNVKVKADFSVSCVVPTARPNLHISPPHVRTGEGIYPVVYPYVFPDMSKCGTNPYTFGWFSSARSNLRAGFMAEKAHFQEKDEFDSPTVVGFSPLSIEQVCIHYVVTVGHYLDPKPASAFFITARHILGGPMYCITNISGMSPAGEPAMSMSGGPIASFQGCAALPPATYNRSLFAPQPLPH